MEGYMKPSLQKDPNHIILHVGTNELILDRTSQDVATSIVNLACSMKGKNCDVSISNIILRTDNKKINQKGQEVNTHLKDMCQVKNIYLIDNTDKIKAHHLNKGKLHLNKRRSNVNKLHLNKRGSNVNKLHLNKRGSNVVGSTFVNELSRILT